MPDNRTAGRRRISAVLSPKRRTRATCARRYAIRSLAMFARVVFSKVPTASTSISGSTVAFSRASRNCAASARPCPGVAPASIASFYEEMNSEARSMSRKGIITALVVVAILLLIWIELAVGLVGTPWAGS